MLQSGRRMLFARFQRWLAEMSGGQYSFWVNGSQHVALNISISAADEFMALGLRLLQTSINNNEFVRRLDDAGKLHHCQPLLALLLQPWVITC